MAKLVGPILSLKATGTIGGTITYQGRKGTTTAYLKTIPYDKKTIQQQNIRSYTTKAVDYWHALPSEYITAWNNFVN